MSKLDWAAVYALAGCVAAISVTSGFITGRALVLLIMGTF